MRALLISRDSHLYAELASQGAAREIGRASCRERVF